MGRVLLVAECSDKFRAVFSFGPVDDVKGYGGQFIYHDRSSPKEFELRAPGKWLHSITTPTFVFEGEKGNIGPLNSMKKTCRNPKVQFYPVRRVTHFSILAPVNKLIAERILKDTGDSTNLTFSEDELNALIR